MLWFIYSCKWIKAYTKYKLSYFHRQINTNLLSHQLIFNFSQICKVKSRQNSAFIHASLKKKQGGGGSPSEKILHVQLQRKMSHQLSYTNNHVQESSPRLIQNYSSFDISGHCYSTFAQNKDWDSSVLKDGEWPTVTSVLMISNHVEYCSFLLSDPVSGW